MSCNISAIVYPALRKRTSQSTTIEICSNRCCLRSDINARRSTAPVFVQDIEQNPSANYGDIKIISLTYKSVCGTTVRGVSARGRSRRSCQPHHRLGAPSPAGSRTCAMAVGQDAGAARPAEEIPHDHLYKVTGLSSTNLQKLAQEHAAPEPEAADFEEAIAATGYGKFNLCLMLCSLPAFFSAVSVTSSTSYIFSRAQCDMNLSLLDMGTVTAMTYGGMISSAMVWGFLSDTLGRRQIMVWGFFCSGLVELTAAMSQNFATLLVMRFASGFLFNGPFAVLISYIAELHRTELRARVILLSSLFYTLASTTLPLLAWALLDDQYTITIYPGYFVLHSWNIFLLTTGLVPLLTGIVFLCLPESPKFHMSRGRNDEAMATFRKIYSLNTGKPAEEFPIKKLVEEKQERQRGGVAALRGGGAQLAPLFRAPYGKWLLLMCVLHAGSMFGSNTVRLWYPHLAAMLGSDDADSLCSAIAPSAPPPPDGGAAPPCLPVHTDMHTYLQSAAVGAGSVLTYGIGGVLINRCGKKLVTGFCGIASGVLLAALPSLGTSSVSVVTVVTAALALTALSAASMSSIAVDLFPTALRVMAMATFLMCGRLGTITGAVAFPALIEYGCIPPFITIAAVLGVCGCACYLLPNTTLKKLE
ncbi:synaptic vesicle glycoprotein 2A-like isoform X2 [Bombyx mandarina]|uniref:Synaptic vesicle glycoprotein 2A-like isoform X2 n=1 Tax=Bombyx mandarina TaxID=7092 RepID=A0A6J2KC30_BOMMA|nr:synaptic vesicle glycoprotein 2A-like isoform X2 [Bombyx mandarina]